MCRNSIGDEEVTIKFTKQALIEAEKIIVAQPASKKEVSTKLLVQFFTFTTFVVKLSSRRTIMGMPVRIDDNLYEQARAEAQVEHRTIAGQIEFWAKVGRAALDNPDLPVSFIAEALASLSEPRSDATPFVPRTQKN